jgi:hypothetical protein
MVNARESGNSKRSRFLSATRGGGAERYDKCLDARKQGHDIADIAQVRA